MRAPTAAAVMERSQANARGAQRVSKGIIFKIANNTGEQITVSAKIANLNDWGDATNRPDLNVKGAIGAYGNNHWHEELAQTSSTAPFTVTVAFSLGVTVEVDLLDGRPRRTELSDAKPSRVGPPLRSTPLSSTPARPPIQASFCGAANPIGGSRLFFTALVDPTNWMAALDESLTLDQINIPGTHDSGTYGGSGVEGSRTQAMTITQQLNAGRERGFLVGFPADVFESLFAPSASTG